MVRFFFFLCLLMSPVFVLGQGVMNRLVDASDRPVICIDANNPINTNNGSIAAVPDLLADTETPTVRVNFILGPWSAPDDTTLYSGRNWFGVYDKIVDDYLDRGIEVYGLMTSSAVKSSYTFESAEWVNDYTDNFEKIVDHFKGRVKVYESFNEPNNWGGADPGNATLGPYYFAMQLEQVYRRVKVDNGRLNDPEWNELILVSGPLFSHDIGGSLTSGGDTGRTFLRETYQAGINQLGWTSLKNEIGTYPLDGIGYHIYVQTDTVDPMDILTRMRYNLDQCWIKVSTYEGSDTDKKFWISEIGWRDDSTGSEANQGRNMVTAFDELVRDERVKLATWFCHGDFPEAPVNARWGICSLGGHTEAYRKDSWYDFQDLSRRNVPGNIQLQAEDSDLFYDLNKPTDGGVDYRDDDLDVEACTAGGFNVGYTYPGEWFEFSDVEGDGQIYNVTANLASLDQQIEFSVLVDGEVVLENLSFTPTGGYQDWQIHQLGEIDLTEGTHDIRVEVQATAINFDWFYFEPIGEIPVSSPDVWMFF